MKLIRTLYILRYKQSKREILYKIGITGKTANERCAEIMRTLPNDNKRITVVFERKFFSASKAIRVAYLTSTSSISVNLIEVDNVLKGCAILFP